MSDPVSIIGMIAFGIQVTGALYKTFQLMEEKSRVYEEYELRFNSFRLRLELCRTRITDWINLWLSDGQFKDLEHFWSDDGYRRLNQSMAEISELSKKISDQMYGEEFNQTDKGHPTGFRRRKMKNQMKGILSFLTFNMEKSKKSPTKEDYKTWATFASNLTSQSEIHGPETLSRRIGFALYHNEVLAERIDSLEKRTSDLHILSVNEYRRFRRQELGKEVTPDELKRSKELHRFSKNLEAFAKKVEGIQQSVSDGRQWGLLLRHPDEHGSAEKWSTPSPIHIEFSLNQANGIGSLAPKRIHISHNQYEDEDQSLDKFAREVSRHMNPEKEPPIARPRLSSPGVAWAGQQRSLPFRTIFAQGYLENPTISKATQVDRARLALEYVNWVLLLWDTPWTKHPCSCALRFESFRENSRNIPRHVLSDSPGDSCPTTIDPRYRLVFRGITLAELIIAKPLRCSIEVASDNTGQVEVKEPTIISALAATQSRRVPKLVLQLPEKVSTGTEWRRNSTERIWYTIHQSTGHKGYADAVYYCLEEPLNDPNSTLRRDWLYDFIRNILLPVRDYYEQMVKHYEPSIRTDRVKRLSGVSFQPQWPPYSLADSRT